MFSSRSGVRQKQEDWWCSNCSFKIYGHKDRCGKCGSRRPSNHQHSHTETREPPVLYERDSTKDWYCHSCCFTIYGHKDRCGKCGATRLGQEAAQEEAAAQRALQQERLARLKTEKIKALAAQAKAEKMQNLQPVFLPLPLTLTRLKTLPSMRRKRKAWDVLLAGNRERQLPLYLVVTLLLVELVP